MTRSRTYLDYNASAPLSAEARAAMVASMDTTGNPSSVHAEGRAVRAIVERAREEVAQLVNAKPSEVVFTSGATEANNWVMAAGWDEICVSAIEHDSVLAPARASGARLASLPVSPSGIIDVEAAIATLARPRERSGRVLASLMMANNETGVIQPVAEVAAEARRLGAVMHVDAVQAPGRLDIDFAKIGADAMVLSAHKLGGPRGVGALIIREGVALTPFIKGGGQERRRRGGTENVTGIAGFGAAAAALKREAHAVARINRLRDMLEDGVARLTPAAVIVGREAPRVGNTACIALPGKPAETLVIQLDLEGIAVSAGAACFSGKIKASHVLEAMGLGPDIADSAIRVSLGPETSEGNIAAFLAAWEKVAGRAALAA
jgi:cysteine desulfurase